MPSRSDPVDAVTTSATVPSGLPAAPPPGPPPEPQPAPPPEPQPAPPPGPQSTPPPGPQSTVPARPAGPGVADDLVGVIPAAGFATRLSPLPCSKELLPIDWDRSHADGRPRPRVVSRHLIDRMRHGGMTRLIIVTRADKHDLMRYYGSGEDIGVPVAYQVAGRPWGPPFTVAQAAAFIGRATVLFGFPDILIDPADSYGPLVGRLRESGADVVLGLFDCTAAQAGDWVERDGHDRIVRLRTRESWPDRPPHHLCWMFAAWNARFTDFLVQRCAQLDAEAHALVAADALQGRPGARLPEWPMGALFSLAIDAGLDVRGVHFPGGRFLDVGTAAGLEQAGTFPGIDPLHRPG